MICVLQNRHISSKITEVIVICILQNGILKTPLAMFTSYTHTKTVVLINSGILKSMNPRDYLSIFPLPLFYSSAVQKNFLDDGNVSYLCCPIQQSLSTCPLECDQYDQGIEFYFYLIFNDIYLYVYQFPYHLLFAFQTFLLESLSSS